MIFVAWKALSEKCVDLYLLLECYFLEANADGLSLEEASQSDIW